MRSFNTIRATPSSHVSSRIRSAREPARHRFCVLSYVIILLTFPCAAPAAPFSNTVFFGDSLSDIGNVSQATPIFPFVPKTPGPYYWNGRFSNGPVYAESLTTGLG